MAEGGKKPNSSDHKDGDGESFLGKIGNFIRHMSSSLEGDAGEKVLDSCTPEGFVHYLKSHKCSNVIVMTGAGISTSAGIPDFRSPETGLYHKLEAFNLPYPQAVFEINYFRENPKPFFTLAKELYPDRFKPTLTHYFIRLLHEKNLLLRNYTQNIDTLEHRANIPADKIVEAHGTFYTSHCTTLGCNKPYTLEWMKEKIFEDSIPVCDACKGVVKPDIVFFGESLPPRFFKCVVEDFPKCDCLIVMGTSLVVQPFALFADKVGAAVPRLLINKEPTGVFQLQEDTNQRNVFMAGTCDEGCQKLAELLGWKHELEKLMAGELKQLDVVHPDVNDNSSKEMEIVGQ